MLDHHCHSKDVVARFLAARAHVDQVIAELLVEELGTGGAAPGDGVPAPRAAPRSEVAPVSDAPRSADAATSTYVISAAIADAIAALDLAFELWLGRAVGSAEPELSS